MNLFLRPGVLEETFDQLRVCGAARDECVTYWTGPQETPDLVDQVIQPAHQAGPGSYEIDPAWITRFFLDLRSSKRTARAQIHTHPRGASHSEVDDCFPLAPHPGFFSLVIPDYATGTVTLTGTHLVALNQHGEWGVLDPSVALRES